MISGILQMRKQDLEIYFSTVFLKANSSCGMWMGCNKVLQNNHGSQNSLNLLCCNYVYIYKLSFMFKVFFSILMWSVGCQSNICVCRGLGYQAFLIILLCYSIFQERRADHNRKPLTRWCWHIKENPMLITAGNILISFAISI